MMNTMGEVATLTDKLAMMPDNMLPRLAQQYKSDAITLSLILGEKNRRDRVRNSMKSQAGAQPQPKVNDAVVAGMQQLPEETGIGALPAPNMQRMADGGIAGYDDNNNLAYHNEPVMRMADGGVAHYQFGGAIEDKYRQESIEMGEGRRMQYSPDVQAYAQALEQANKASYAEREKAQQLQGNPMMQQYKPAAPASVATMPSAGYRRGDPRAAAYAVPPMAEQAKQVLAAPELAPQTAITGQGGLPDLAKNQTAPAASAATPSPSTRGVKEQFLKDVEQFAPKSETAEDALAKRKAMLGDEGPALSKYEAKLLAQEAAAPREKDEAFWMAVTQAGLAAAAGKSQHALQNIAEGFGTGLAGYKDALKDFKKAEQDRERAMAEIEKARRAEKRGDVDAALAREEKSKEYLNRHQDRVAAGLASLAGQEISGQYSLAGHQVSAAASRESTQAYRQAALEQRNMGLVENIRKNIEAKLANQFLADPAGLAAETERRLQIELQRYPGLAQYAGTPSGATKFSPADQALVNKYATPPR